MVGETEGRASAVADEGKKTLFDAFLERARRIRTEANNLTLRSDNGLVFGAKAFVKVVRRYGPEQEYITPYCPEQNGIIERFFKTLKCECVWQHRFRERDHAFRVIPGWMDRYREERPYQTLGYVTRERTGSI